MDGNGRWAEQRGMPRISGHSQGRYAVRRTVEACRELGVGYLTLYTFSVENWRRPREEVEALMSLIEVVAREETEDLHRNNVRVNVIGRREGLPQSLLEELDRDMALTRENSGMVLNLAINYGGRAEIVDAVKHLVATAKNPDEIDEETISNALYTRGQPDPDLLIRTAGEQRLSNFLLWQMAYSEIYVTDVLWPDFTKADLYEAILDYQRRVRKFGGLKPN
jgi:undecaprenyl diphosphate synthase